MLTWTQEVDSTVGILITLVQAFNCVSNKVISISLMSKCCNCFFFFFKCSDLQLEAFPEHFLFVKYSYLQQASTINVLQLISNIMICNPTITFVQLISNIVICNQAFPEQAPAKASGTRLWHLVSNLKNENWKIQIHSQFKHMLMYTKIFYWQGGGPLARCSWCWEKLQRHFMRWEFLLKALTNSTNSDLRLNGDKYLQITNVCSKQTLA